MESIHELDLVLSTLRELFGDLSPACATSAPHGGEHTSREPQSQEPSSVTGGQCQGYAGHCSPAVSVAHGFNQSYAPARVRYGAIPMDYQPQHLAVVWRDSTLINTQNYLGATPTPPPPEKPPYIRRPPNAFMVFMRENRQQVMATLKPKNSVEANSILGHMWKSMSSEQQAEYYQLAAEERKKHAELHPNWSSKDNYGRKMKRKRKTT